MGNDLPPTRHDEETVATLVEALRAAEIDRDAIAELSNRIAREGFPQSLAGEPLPIVSVERVGGANISPVDPGSLTTEFAQETGFEVALSMALRITASELQAEVERVVLQHDQPGVDRLLISVGAPDRDGLVFPSEPLVVEQPPLQPVATENMKEITLHFFGSGEIRGLDSSRR